MNTVFTARKINLRDSYKDHVEQKLEKIQKFFSDDADATVVVSLEKDRFTCEITIRSRSIMHPLPNPSGKNRIRSHPPGAAALSPRAASFPSVHR